MALIADVLSRQQSAFHFVDLVLFTLRGVHSGDLCLAGDLLHVLKPLLLFLKLLLLRTSQIVVLGRGGLNPALSRLVGRFAILYLLLF